MSRKGNGHKGVGPVIEKKTQQNQVVKKEENS